MLSRRVGAPDLEGTLAASRCLLYSLIWICLALLCAPTAYGEGTQTGTLVGTVVDSADQPLPDVPVQLFGIQVQRQTTTDSTGRFRFQGLPIGSYRVAAELLGLSTYRDGLRIFINKTTETSLTLTESPGPSPELPVEEDLIQVLAIAPLIDRYETRVSSSVRREFLDELPLARVYQSVALLLPSVVGGEDGNPNVSGALRGSNVYLVDGVDTTDSTTGLFGLNLSYEAIQEVDVTTAAPPVEYGRASGAIINVVTRSGGNSFRGSARWLSSNDAWNSDFESATDTLQNEVEAANSGDDNLDSTIAATLAGPLWEDRVGFFATFEQANSSFLRPTFEGTQWDQDTSIRTSGLKVNAQTQKHTFLAQYTADSASFNTFASFDRRPGENRAVDIPDELRAEVYDPLPGDIFALQQRSQDGDFVKLQWYTIVNANFSLTTALASQDRRLERTPLNQGSPLGSAVHEAAAVPYIGSPDDPTVNPEIIFTTWNGLTDEGFEDRQRQQANVTADYFLQLGSVDHGLRFGADLQQTSSLQSLNFSGEQGIDRATGRPVEGQLISDVDSRAPCITFGELCVDFDPVTGEFQPAFLFNFWERPARETEAENLALFVNDAISFGRWLISAGVRYEQVSGEDDSGRQLVDDTSLSPRLGVKYDPKGDGKSFLSLTYSRFTEPFPQQYLDDYTQAEPLSGYSSYFWSPNTPACVVPDATDIQSPCWRFTGEKPLEPLTKSDPNLDLKRSKVDEIVAAFEQQLTDNTSLRLSWIQRDWRDLWDDVLLLDGTRPRLDPVVGTVENLPQAERTHRSIQLLLQRRFADRWQMLASYTWSETEGNLFQSTGRSSFQDLANFDDTNIVNRFGLAPYDRSHQLKIFGNYQVPIGAYNLSLGGVFRYETGIPYQEEALVDAGTRFETPRGTLRLDDVWQLDLSASFDFDFERENLGLEFKLEVFNLTNEQNVLGVETISNTGEFGQPRSLADLQAPRNLRLTLGLRF